MFSLKKISENVVEKNKCSIYPDTFFRLFTKSLDNGNPWPVNVEMLINNKRKNIIFGCLKPEYFNGNETHLSVINLKTNNTASVQLKELSMILYRIFKKIEYKFVILINIVTMKLKN